MPSRDVPTSQWENVGGATATLVDYSLVLMGDGVYELDPGDAGTGVLQEMVGGIFEIFAAGVPNGFLTRVNSAPVEIYK